MCKKFPLVPLIVIPLLLIVINISRLERPVPKNPALDILDRAVKVDLNPPQTQQQQHIVLYQYYNLSWYHPKESRHSESYFDSQTHRFRLVEWTNKTKQWTTIYAYDGIYLYALSEKDLPAAVIYRVFTPTYQPFEGEIDRYSWIVEMESDDHLQLIGEENWPDGRKVYHLESEKNLTVGDMGFPAVTKRKITLYVDTQTYIRAGLIVSGEKNHQTRPIEIKLLSVLPITQPIVWDLSDLSDITILDKP